MRSAAAPGEPMQSFECNLKAWALGNEDVRIEFFLTHQRKARHCSGIGVCASALLVGVLGSCNPAPKVLVHREKEPPARETDAFKTPSHQCDSVLPESESVFLLSGKAYENEMRKLWNWTRPDGLSPEAAASERLVALDAEGQCLSENLRMHLANTFALTKELANAALTPEGPALADLLSEIERRPVSAEEVDAKRTAAQQEAVSFNEHTFISTLLGQTLTAPAFLLPPKLPRSRGAEMLQSALGRASLVHAFSFALQDASAPPSDVKRLSALKSSAFKNALSALAVKWMGEGAFHRKAIGVAESYLGIEALRSNKGSSLSEVQRREILRDFDDYTVRTLLQPGSGFAKFFTQADSLSSPTLDSFHPDSSLDADTGRHIWRAEKRKGALGHPAFLIVHANYAQPDPVKRGVAVLQNILCISLPSPPADALEQKIPDPPESTNRERFEFLATFPACASCHRIINPVGYLFEEYDQIGRFRAMDAGKPVDASGHLPDMAALEGEAMPPRMQSIADLSTWISQSRKARGCFAERVQKTLLPSFSEGLAGPTQAFLDTGDFRTLVLNSLWHAVFTEDHPGDAK